MAMTVSNVIKENGGLNLSIMTSTVVGFVLANAFVEFSGSLIDATIKPFQTKGDGTEHRFTLNLWNKTFEMGPVINGAIKLTMAILLSYILIRSQKWYKNLRNKRQ